MKKPPNPDVYPQDSGVVFSDLNMYESSRLLREKESNKERANQILKNAELAVWSPEESSDLFRKWDIRREILVGRSSDFEGVKFPSNPMMVMAFPKGRPLIEVPEVLRRSGTVSPGNHEKWNPSTDWNCVVGTPTLASVDADGRYHWKTMVMFYRALEFIDELDLWKDNSLIQSSVYFQSNWSCEFSKDCLVQEESLEKIEYLDYDFRTVK